MKITVHANVHNSRTAWTGIALFILAVLTPPSLGGDTLSTSDTLSGDLHGTIRNIGRPYIISADIAVPVGETVVIEPGVAMLFGEFTGLQIHGTLIARGTNARQIYFSSIKDRALSGATDSVDAAPYDWNGIMIDENALGSAFEHCVVSYSLYGIKSLTRYVSVKSGVFFRNGKSNMSVSGTEMNIGDAPFSYSLAPATPAPTPALSSTAPVPGVRVHRGKPALTVVSAMVLAGGLTAGIWKTFEYRASVERFNALNAPQNVANLKSISIEQDWNTAKAKKNQDLLYMAVGYGAAVIGCIGITISF